MGRGRRVDATHCRDSSSESTPRSLPPANELAGCPEPETHGIEFPALGNPTKNLRLMANVSRNLTTITQLGAITQNYVDQNTPLWLSKSSNLAIDPITNTLKHGRRPGE